MAVKSRKIKNALLKKRQECREGFYDSPLHRQSISKNFNLFCQHLEADFDFAMKAPFYNPMDEIDLIPFMSFLFEQLFTWIQLFYLAFVYSALSLFFGLFFQFNLTELSNTLNVFINATACLLMVSVDIAVHIGLFAISPVSRLKATFFSTDIETLQPTTFLDSTTSVAPK
jgi:hypothetical protein